MKKVDETTIFTRHYRAFFVSVFISATLFAYNASAGLIHDIFDCDDLSATNCTSPAGTIIFPSASGNTNLGVSLTYPFLSFDESDIQSIEWVIDTSSWTLTSFEMLLSDNPGCDELSAPCSSSGVSFEGFISPGVNITGFRSRNCDVGSPCMDTSAPARSLFVAREIAEPASFGLVLLAGFAASARRYRAHPTTR